MRQLKYFLKVAEMGSITAAAREMRMTQPALSRQIRAFEDDCGWSLIDRGAKSIRLTRAGKIVVKEGKKLVQEMARSLAQMQRQIDGGVIRVGYAPSLGGEILKRAMGCFMQRHSSVKIELLDSSSEEMRKKCLEGEIDLMVGAETVEKQLDWEFLLEKRICLAIPKSHALAKKRVIESKQLDGMRVLLLSRHEYPEYFAEMQRFFRELGINAKVAGEFDGIESLRVALEAGIGVAFVAESSQVGNEIKLVRVKPEATPVRVAVGWRNDKALDPITAAFIEELRQAGLEKVKS